MKSIGSNKITGPEAILTATVQYWAFKRDLSGLLRSHLSKVGYNDFAKSKNPRTLGKKLIESGFDVEDVVQNYWDFCKENEPLKFIVETAVRSMKGEKVPAAKAFVNSHVIELCGSIIKKESVTYEAVKDSG